jgi:membrane-bound serine protease (ClpP class)
MTALESPLFANLLYLVLVAGVWLAALAIVSPGTGVLEVLAFFALAVAGMGTVFLPLNSWAVIVFVLGILTLILALRWKPVELWLLLSAAAFCVGSIFLFRLPSGGAVVHPLLATVVSLFTLGFFWLAIRQAISAHHARPSVDPSAVIGEIGQVRTELDPTGSVYVAGELWSARSEQTISAGSNVRVDGREGLTLMVSPIEESQTESS